MGRLIYSMLTTLDGYVADAHGDFDWGMPDPELHRYLEELTRPVHTYLYGRRMYETMVFWETAGTPDQPAFVAEFARTWRAADKIVYSRTLETVSSERTRIVREFDPAAVHELKASRDGDLTVDGPGLAAAAIAAGLVDEIAPVLVPVVVGGGTRFLPDGARLDLELADERRFANGAVHLRYHVRSPSAGHLTPPASA